MNKSHSIKMLLSGLQLIALVIGGHHLNQAESKDTSISTHFDY